MKKAQAIVLWLFIPWLSVTLFYGCKERKNEIPTLDFSCMMSHLDSMQQIVDTAKIGDVDGTFPSANATELLAAIDDLKTGISKAKAGYFVLPFEVQSYCIAASKSVTTFMNSFQTTLEPGTPAELQVFGVDNKGHIDFGESQAFSSSSRFTVESWLKYEPGFFESAIGSFLSTFHQADDALFRGWMINFLGSNLRTTIGMGPQQLRVLEWGGAYPSNYGQWNHIVTVYDESLASDQLKMYVNGEVFFSKTNDIVDNAGTLQKYQANTKDMSMWAFAEPQDNSRCMTGYIRKFRLWNSAKNQSEIKSLMSTEVAGNETDLICAWDFTEVPDDPDNIADKTGRFSAKIVGQHKWHKLIQ